MKLTEIQKNQLKNKDWRVNSLYKIINKEQQKVTFKLNEAQEHFNKHKFKRNIILKSRQLGFTTLEAIDMIDDSLWKRNFQGLLISYDKESSLDIFNNKIDFAWKNYKLKEWYKVTTDRRNQLTFDFGDGSVSSISVRSSGRSGTFNRVHISEFAKICKKYPDKANEILTGTIPSVPLDGRIDIESTAEGEMGHFYEMFWESWNKGEPKAPTDYKAFFYNWTWDNAEISKIKEPEKELPLDFIEYQRKHELTDIQITYYYYKFLSLNKNWNRMKQEYPTDPEEAFVGSGNKLFDMDRVADLKQYIRQGDHQGDWIYYDDYIPGHRYALGADVALGVGQDSSTASIVDFTPMKPKLVAEYCSNKIAPDMFAYEIKNGATRFGNCLVAVERNNHGYTTLNTLKQFYFNLYKEEKGEKQSDEQTEKLGWHTNAATKPKMLYELNDAINQGIVEIPSKWMIEELRTYDKEDLAQIRFDDEQAKHWDRLISLAICWQMKTHVDTAFSPEDLKTKY